MVDLMDIVFVDAGFVSFQFQSGLSYLGGIRYHLCLGGLLDLLVALVSDQLVLRQEDVEIVLLSYAAVHLHDLQVCHLLRRERSEGVQICGFLLFLTLLK